MVQISTLAVEFPKKFFLFSFFIVPFFFVEWGKQNDFCGVVLCHNRFLVYTRKIEC